MDAALLRDPANRAGCTEPWLRFAAGEPIEKEPTPAARGADEISHLYRHFSAIAATANRVRRSLRTISNCNQALVHASDESSLLHQVCEVIVRDGGYRMVWVGMADSPDGEFRRVALCRSVG